jgi:serine/threonine-protein kinase
MLVAANGVTDFVKLLDFGISQASWRPELSQPNVVTGTPEYMAPEQAAVDPARIGPRTDQWALAAIAYELLTGLDPFQGETPLAVLDRVVNTAPLVPSDLAPGLGAEVDAVILRGLSKDPADRYPDVVAFSTALRAAFGLALPDVDDGASRDGAAETSPAPATPSAETPPIHGLPATRKTTRLFRRRRWRMVLVPAAVALAALLATLVLASAPSTSGAPRIPAVARWTQAAIHFAARQVARLR